MVVSSLALHYVAGYDALITSVANWLRPGGQLIYSVEHPVRTARDPMTGWLTTADGRTVWPVDEVLARRPDLADHRRSPPLLIVAARRPSI